ncbi:hypothetical protein A2704_00595 [Candidatus Kaiserbacteria bacterium RIFCSPHIGHO2_01_FULL_54_36b]|uniref:Uncharacterized protein n=1 Tax=Candidatus Kaiserbacteria bacterium RIFCSPHIGHO2_01_FULL_54_36b TaxID=1798483 RepID=A0A1F6CSH4_9BACT|nr:MAG: hypothetical protein A2704_00595 [Candidatus Kaiserbacteria bacterium RIFCSPHIGHO2_01_FULL_54_36b]
MAAAFVFHLMRLKTAGIRPDVLLRYNFDPRCDVERGDVWTRTATNGEVTSHRVTALRIFEGAEGDELHAFTEPMYELVAR